MSAEGGQGGVLCVGRLYCDLVFTGVPRLPTMGTEVFAEGLGLHAGGGAAITAAYLAALGRPAALAATLPAEPFGAAVQSELARAGVAMALCTPPPHDADPQLTVVIAGAEDRAFLTRRAGPALPRLSVDLLAGSGASHLHIGELATLLEVPDLPTLARRAGMTVSLDCSWHDAPPVEAGRLIAQVDVFLPNAAETAQLADLGIGPETAPLTVIKQGAAGAEAVAGRQRLHAPAHQVPVLDTTGAGDAFNGGFLDAWLVDAPLDACLAAGHACGAAAVQARGGVPGAAALALGDDADRRVAFVRGA